MYVIKGLVNLGPHYSKSTKHLIMCLQTELQHYTSVSWPTQIRHGYWQPSSVLSRNEWGRVLKRDVCILLYNTVQIYLCCCLLVTLSLGEARAVSIKAEAKPSVVAGSGETGRCVNLSRGFHREVLCHTFNWCHVFVTDYLQHAIQAEQEGRHKAQDAAAAPPHTK